MSSNQKSALVIGAGAWGAAIAETISHNLSEVMIYDKFQPDLSKPHPRLGIHFAKNIKTIDDLSDCPAVDVIFFVIPSEVLISVAKELSNKVSSNTPIVICTKGLDGKANQLYTQSLSKIFGKSQVFAILSGPNFATQVAIQEKSITTIACQDNDALELLSEICSTNFFKVEAINDVNGAQILGAYKNVIALTMGFLKGKHMSENFIARFLCNSVSELKILFEYFDADQSTILSSCGIGDIYLTSTSTESRNYSFGQKLAQEQNAKQLMKENKITVEGVKAVLSFYNIAKNGGFSLKIVDTLYKILYENKMIDNVIVEQLI